MLIPSLFNLLRGVGWPCHGQMVNTLGIPYNMGNDGGHGATLCGFLFKSEVWSPLCWYMGLTLPTGGGFESWYSRNLGTESGVHIHWGGCVLEDHDLFLGSTVCSTDLLSPFQEPVIVMFM